MGLVVRGVKILSIPAGREDDRGADTPRAVLGRELARVLAIARSKALAVSEATVADRGLVDVLLVRRISRDHSEAGLERRHLAVLGAVRHVVYRHSSILLQAEVGELGDALEGAVFRRPEV